MFLPIKDINPTERTPVITISIIAINVIVYIYQMSLGPNVNAFIASYGATPFEITRMTDLTHAVLDGRFTHFPGPNPIFITLITSMFIHGSLLHLGGNMLYLWIFGNNIEDLIGPFKFSLFYLISGLAAHFLHIITDPSSLIPTVGASGAIAGLLGAYLIAYPRARVLTVVFFFFIRMIILPAFVVIIFWFFIQLISAMASLGGMQSGGVAWFAHVGGFLAGVVLIYIMAGKKLRRIKQNDRRNGYF
jgi:membrane associated rhomboid family serine protease